MAKKSVKEKSIEAALWESAKMNLAIRGISANLGEKAINFTAENQ